MARKLVRALVADPLADEGSWESVIVDELAEDGGPLLLRSVL
jgi:hypothetical protein